MSSLLKTQHARDGFSIIEVLTSIVVAMIGVFGVMILIPFAVKQAQTGLDSDAAVTVARNANSQFEIGGFRNPTNWIFVRPSTGDAEIYNPFDIVADTDSDGTADSPDAPEIFSIDPLGILENLGGLTIEQAMANANFPFNRLDAGTSYPDVAGNDLTFKAVNLLVPTGVGMNKQLARRMFRAADDLIFGEATDDLQGPEAIYDQGGTLSLKRQARGRISWSAIVIPVKVEASVSLTERWSYRMHILVYKDRQTLMFDPDGRMRTAKLDSTLNTGLKIPLGNIYLETGVDVEGNLNRDDWVMLINRSPTAEIGFRRNVSFCRVVGVSNGGNASITLDGPDYDFGDGSQPTFIVHLKNVVGVYERTFAPEFESNWNVTY